MVGYGLLGSTTIDVDLRYYDPIRGILEDDKTVNLSKEAVEIGMNWTLAVEQSVG